MTSADLGDAAVRIVAHHDAARIARQTLTRVLDDRLTGRVGIGEHRSIHVDYHLIPFAGGAGIDSVVERGLGDECECVRLLLLDRRRFRGTVLVSRFCWTVYVLRSRGTVHQLRSRRTVAGGFRTCPLMQRLSRRECLNQHCTGLGVEPRADDHPRARLIDNV